MTTARRAVATAALAVVIWSAPAAAGAEEAPLQRRQQVRVRTILDGGGPSHIVARGRALIVLDGNEGLVRRYELGPDDSIGALTACSTPRNFSPRYVQPYATGIRVLGEEPRPSKVASNSRLPTLVLKDAFLASMKSYEAESKTRPPSCGEVSERPTNLPAISRFARQGLSIGLKPSTVAPRGGGLLVGPEPHAELLSARIIGVADGYGPAVLRRELAGGNLGTINVALWVTLYKRGSPTSIRIEDHRTEPTGEVKGLKKRGFDFAAVAGKSLFVLGTTCGDSFCIDRYALVRLPAGSGAGNNPVGFINLSDGPAAEFREDPPLAAESTEVSYEAETFPAVRAWQDRLTDAVAEYAFAPWTYPSSARAIPCGSEGPDNCPVRTSGGRLIAASMASAADGRVSQKGDKGDAYWWGPRNLIEAGLTEPPLSQRGVPYPFGGNSTAKAFAAAVTAPLHQPVGHIRETLVGVDDDQYPLGIDCSSFVGKIFGIQKGTDRWATDTPDPAEMRRIEDLRDAHTGDVIFKKGHIVIFNRMPQEGENRAVEVFEATSRCGRVCRSVYDADFFNGWRILRLKHMTGGGSRPAVNPFWPKSAPRS